MVEKLVHVIAVGCLLIGLSLYAVWAAQILGALP
jgi:hypothetical protein